MCAYISIETGGVVNFLVFNLWCVLGYWLCLGLNGWLGLWRKLSFGFLSVFFLNEAFECMMVI